MRVRHACGYWTTGVRDIVTMYDLLLQEGFLSCYNKGDTEIVGSQRGGSFDSRGEQEGALEVSWEGVHT
ncbi:uncharacterized protein G2W53_026335 [Senna tora]|uniref:Uncharacterized protein n=1 Tax=Senna tora TaxID=362788 RepID=A0A834WF02_9FABA|nr:uncharacterized protein G2W53_026335 [Senna tora]